MCKGKKNPKDSPSKSQSTTKDVQEEEQEESSDSDFTFQVRVGKRRPRNCATVEVRVNGVKGGMKADSCSTANIIDEHKLEKLQSSLRNKVAVRPTDTRLFSFAPNLYPLLDVLTPKLKAPAPEAEPQPLFRLPREPPNLDLS